jgi:hypothetical protein
VPNRARLAREIFIARTDEMYKKQESVRLGFQLSDREKINKKRRKTRL